MDDLERSPVAMKHQQLPKTENSGVRTSDFFSELDGTYRTRSLFEDASSGYSERAIKIASCRFTHPQPPIHVLQY
jgi:hypothetical protein